MTRSSAETPEPEVRTRPRHQLTVRHLFVLVPIAAFGWRAAVPLGDNSFLWHVRAGALQLDRGEVLRTDPFSFTAGGEAWRTQSWLIELGYGWLERSVGSLQWAPAMIAIASAVTLSFVGLSIYRRALDPRRTALVVALVALTGMMFAVPRPVLLSFLLLAVFVVVLQNSERLAWTLIPLAWLWASIHGLFVIGLGLVVLEAVRQRSRRLLGVAVLSGAATLITAHGLGVLHILLDFAENREALTFLSEWQRPDFTKPFLLAFPLIIVAIAGAVGLRRLDARYLVVAVPFGVLGFAQLRSVFPALLVLAPFAAAIFRAPAGSRTGASGSPVINWALAVSLLLVGGLGLARPLSFDESDLPPAAAREALTGDRVFHGPGAGGLLIWAEHPERKVFVDDRAELYGAEVFEELVATLEGTSGTDLLDRQGLDEALLKTSWALGETLEGAGWAETYRDDHWVVYSRP